MDLAPFISGQNEDAMLSAHIETKKGVDAMSISVGAPGDHHNLLHLAAIQRLAKAARRRKQRGGGYR